MEVRRGDLKISVISPLKEDEFDLSFRAASRDLDSDDGEHKFNPRRGNVENPAYSGVLLYEGGGESGDSDGASKTGQEESPVAAILFCDRNYTGRCVLSVYKTCRNVVVHCKICNVLMSSCTPCDAVYGNRRDCGPDCCRMEQHMHEEAMKYPEWYNAAKMETVSEPPASPGEFRVPNPPSIKSENAAARASNKFVRSNACKASKLFEDSDSSDEEKEFADGKLRRVKSKYVSSSSDEDEETEPKKKKKEEEEEEEEEKGEKEKEKKEGVSDGGSADKEREDGEEERKEEQQEEEEQEIMPSQVMEDDDDDEVSSLTAEPGDDDGGDGDGAAVVEDGRSCLMKGELEEKEKEKGEEEKEVQPSQTIENGDASKKDEDEDEDEDETAWAKRLVKTRGFTLTKECADRVVESSREKKKKKKKERKEREEKEGKKGGKEKEEEEKKKTRTRRNETCNKSEPIVHCRHCFYHAFTATTTILQFLSRLARNNFFAHTR